MIHGIHGTREGIKNQGWGQSDPVSVLGSELSIQAVEISDPRVNAHNITEGTPHVIPASQSTNRLPARRHVFRQEITEQPGYHRTALELANMYFWICFQYGILPYQNVLPFLLPYGTHMQTELLLRNSIVSADIQIQVLGSDRRWDKVVVSHALQRNTTGRSDTEMHVTTLGTPCPSEATSSRGKENTEISLSFSLLVLLPRQCFWENIFIIFS